MKRLTTLKHSILSITCILTFISLFAGVMRDDVSETAYTNLAAQKQFNCVGRVFNGDKPAGSCVLIGKRYVLSAAHVFMKYITKPDTMLMDGQKIVAYLSIGAQPVDIGKCRFEFGGKTYNGKNVEVYHEYQWKNQKMDMVLIELDADVTDITPATLNTKPDEMGADVTGIGYGASGFGGQAQSVVPKGKKIAGQNTVDSLGGAKLNGVETMLVCDFDSPTRPGLNRIGSASPKPLEYICAGGDSGGGLFRQRNGQWELIGICHGQEAGISTLMKNGYYGLLMEFTRVSVFSNWIKQSTKS